MSTMKDFEVIKQVGKGSYGVVYKVRRKSDKKIYAIKTISLSKVFTPVSPVFRSLAFSRKTLRKPAPFPEPMVSRSVILILQRKCRKKK